MLYRLINLQRVKKIAFIFLFVFTLVQVLPAAAVWSSSSTLIFMVDEEKSEDKKDNNQKDKKEFIPGNNNGKSFNNKVQTAFNTAEKLHPAPILAIQAPPPDFK